MGGPNGAGIIASSTMPGVPASAYAQVQQYMLPGSAMPSAGTGLPASGGSTGGPYISGLSATEPQTIWTPSHIPAASSTSTSANAAEHSAGKPQTSTIQSMLDQFDAMPLKAKKQWAAWLAIAGYAGSVDIKQINDWVQTASMTDVRSAYMNLLQDAAYRYNNGNGEKVSISQLLQRGAAYRLGNNSDKWDGKLNSLYDNKTGVNQSLLGGQTVTPVDGATKTTTGTSSQIDLMDPKDAEGLTRAMLQQELGRDPTQQEYQDFLGMLQNAQRANPTTSTTTSTQTYDAQTGGWNTTSQNTVQHDGISQAGLDQLAYEKAQQNPDWAEWQAVGTYAPALFSALGATVPGV